MDYRNTQQEAIHRGIALDTLQKRIQKGQEPQAIKLKGKWMFPITNEENTELESEIEANLNAEEYARLKLFFSSTQIESRSG